MAETYTVRDPFLNKDVKVSNRLVDRLRGKYAVGPTLENGEPEFGWKQMPTTPVQVEAADEIERLQAVLKGIAEFCSGDDKTLGAIARLAAIRNTADQALRVSKREV